MIKLHSFGPSFGLIDASPFVAKVKLFMILHDISFTEVNDLNKLSKAPKQKFPYIEDGTNIVADSSFIIEYLSSKYSIDMDAWLTAEQRSIAHLVGKSLEENLYWCLLHSRWISNDTWQIVKTHYFDSIPFPLNKIIPAVAQKSMIKRLNGHGMGAHSEDQILMIAKQSFTSLSSLLGNKAFFFGEKMSSLDVIAFTQLSSFTLASLNNSFNRAAREHKNLVEFTERIQATYLPNL